MSLFCELILEYNTTSNDKANLSSMQLRFEALGLPYKRPEDRV